MAILHLLDKRNGPLEYKIILFTRKKNKQTNKQNE